MKRLLDHDKELGIKTWFHHDPSTDEITVHSEQDVTDIVDANKRAMADSDKSYKGDMHRVASIPLDVYMKLNQEGITKDPKAFKRWLNDPDNRYFRTKPGRV